MTQKALPRGTHAPGPAHCLSLVKPLPINQYGGTECLLLILNFLSPGLCLCHALPGVLSLLFLGLSPTCSLKFRSRITSSGSCSGPCRLGQVPPLAPADNGLRHIMGHCQACCWSLCPETRWLLKLREPG